MISFNRTLFTMHTFCTLHNSILYALKYDIQNSSKKNCPKPNLQGFGQFSFCIMLTIITFYVPGGRSIVHKTFDNTRLIICLCKICVNFLY